MDMGFSCRKNAFFPGVHKIDAPISGPRIADNNFTDTRIFLILVSQHDQVGAIPPPPFLSVSPLESMRSGGAIPPPRAPLKRGISAILARYPIKTRQIGAIPPSAIRPRKGIARYGGVSRIGSLRGGSGAFSWEGRAWGVGGGCRGLAV